MKIVLAILLAATVAVAQHQQGNVANVPDQKFAVSSAPGDCRHYPMTASKPTTKVTCEKVGGTWDDTSFYFYTGSLSVGTLSIVQQGSASVTKDFKQSVDVDSQTGRVVKLSDEEYAHLQKLRQAVDDEEKKIALAYGVLLVPRLIHAGTNTCLATSYITGLPSCDTDQYQAADRWQFRGQFLLVNVPKAVQTEAK
jgi:hypothetical protein